MVSINNRFNQNSFLFINSVKRNWDFAVRNNGFCLSRVLPLNYPQVYKLDYSSEYVIRKTNSSMPIFII